MLENFFQLSAVPINQLTGNYNPSLVILSYLVAVFASYIALDFTGRLRDPNNTQISSLLWWTGGAIAMGAGIWSMHFIGMLSFTMPGMMMHYELFWTTLSLIVAIVASAFALSLLKIKKLKLLHFIVGGIILGLAIASMHYTGMEGMKIEMDIRYLPSLFILSIVIAIAASEAALWLALKSNQAVSKVRIQLKIISAIIMGMAICGMHYTGMAAAIFTPLKNTPHAMGSLDPTLLSMAIAGVTFIILGIAFFASTYKEALNQQQFEKARQLGMAEVSASVLHNVGNVLNSVNVSADLVADKIIHSKLRVLEDLKTLLNEHKQDLTTFLTTDSRGKNVPNYLEMIAQVRNEEEQFLYQEISTLIKNIQLIKAIISTQQNLSKIEAVEQIISINQVLDEALLISDFDFNRHGINIEKNYARLSAIKIDKVKFLQILVNIIQNAKESLIASAQQNKKIIISSGTDNKKTFYIKIQDNGVGINSTHMNKIFIYGFTTKQMGHGFGLHTSILTAKGMGGDIRVESEGVEKGAVFIVDLPYKIPQK